MGRSIFYSLTAAAVNYSQIVWGSTRMLRYRFPSCRSIRILIIRISGPDPWTLLGGLLPQEADRRCDFVGVDGVSVAGVESLVEGDVSTSRQDTDGDLMCCNRNNDGYHDDRTGSRRPDRNETQINQTYGVEAKFSLKY